MSILDIMFGGKKSTLPWQNESGYMTPDYALDSPYKYNPTNYGTSLAESIPSLMYNFKGINTKNGAGILDKLNQVNNARMDINDPMYQQIYGQQKQQGQQNLAESIQEMVNQNRRLSALGRTPLFSQERGGETLFRGLNKGYLDVQNQAAGNTQNILGSAAQGLQGAYGAANTQAMLENQNNYQKAKGQTGVVGILKNLFGL